jgi:hypothetical protein
MQAEGRVADVGVACRMGEEEHVEAERLLVNDVLSRQ